MTIILFTK